MAAMEILSVLALKPLIEGARQAATEKTSEGAIRFLGQRLGDAGAKGLKALTRANERAWQAFEIALGGDSLANEANDKQTDGDRQGLRRQVQTFQGSTPPAVGIAADPFFRRRGREQLRAAHQAGLLVGGIDLQRLLPQTATFAGLGDARQFLRAEWAAIGQLADELDQAGYGELAQVIRLEPQNQSPLLALAARYFFQRLVVADAALAKAFDFARWETLGPSQLNGFEQLERAIADQGKVLADVLAVTAGLRADMLDLRAELQRLGKDHQAHYETLLEMFEHANLSPREVRGDSAVSLVREEDRSKALALVGQYRALPAEQRRKLPALLHGVGLLLAAVGDFDAAQKDLESFASATGGDAFARAAALHNAYRVALARRRWDEALALLKQAVTLDPQRWTPFPLDRYEPQRILRSGPAAVVFLCRNPFLNAEVVVYALHADEGDPRVEAFFGEARVLKQVDHPAVARVHDFAYADSGRRARPYLAAEYFDGKSLEDQVKDHGKLSALDALYIGRVVAEGLQTVHACGLAHDNLQPAGVLVRKVPPEPPRTDARGKVRQVVNERPPWLVKVIDFGLSKLTAHEKGQTSDLAGWVKTCRFALGSDKDRAALPSALTAFLNDPPADFGEAARQCQLLEASLRPPDEKSATPTAAPLGKVPVGPPTDLPPLPEDIVDPQNQLRELERNLAALENHAKDLSADQKQRVADEIAKNPTVAPAQLCPLAPKVPTPTMTQYVQLVQKRYSLKRQLEVKLTNDLHTRLTELFDKVHETHGFPREHWEAWLPVLDERYPVVGKDKLRHFAEKLYVQWCDQCDERDWQEAQRLNSADGYRRYLVWWLKGKHVKEAHAAMEPLKHWEEACRLDTAEGYERYLDLFPTSPHTEAGKGKAERILRQLLMSCPGDPGLRSRYLKRRTDAGRGRDRWRAWGALWLWSTLMGCVVWGVIAPLAAYVASQYLPDLEGWWKIALLVPLPAGLLTGLVSAVLFGIGESRRFAELGPLPLGAYYGNPKKAREKYPC